MTQQITWPRKRREIQNHHLDSTLWNDFVIRDDDVFIVTYAKSGTTWLQQIVGQLIFQGAEGVPINAISPWLELRVMAAETKATLEGQQHRRFIKTHLSLDTLKFSPAAKYIYLARDGRDVLWSAHAHHLNASQLYYDLANDTPGRVGPPFERPDPDIRRYFRRWLDEDGYPFWPFWDHVRGWWEARGLPNVLLVHFSDLKADPAAEMRRIADFLSCHIDEAIWPAILEHCSFAYMKAHAAEITPLGGMTFEGGAPAFFNKGSNGRWRDVLTADDVAHYEELARAKLGAECAQWLAEGSRTAAAA